MFNAIQLDFFMLPNCCPHKLHSALGVEVGACYSRVEAVSPLP